MTTRPLPRGRRLAFILLTVVLAVGSVEVTLNAAYFFVKRRPLWQSTPRFEAHGWLSRVDDERYVTAKRNFRGRIHSRPAPPGTVDWTLTIDDHGFRTGINQPAPDEWNVVFIGDSVPFGMYLDDDLTVPSQVQGLLRSRQDSRGVINAALPASSLDQAVQRYRYEIVGRYRVDTVVMQVYDPASQFAIFGRDWDVGKNWATWPAVEKTELGWLRYSALYHALRRTLDLDPFRERLDVADREAVARYVAAIQRSLELLASLTRVQGTRVIVLPATVPAASYATMSAQRRLAVDTLNDTLRQIAGRMGFRFVDTRVLLGQYADDRVFLDACCHLSAEGAFMVAQEIVRHLPPDRRAS